MGIWCCAKLETIGNTKLSKKLSKSITALQYLLNFAPTLGNLKRFNVHENRAFCNTPISGSTERKAIAEFSFNRCFRESSLRNYKKSSALRSIPTRMFSCSSKLLSVQGSFAHRISDKTFPETSPLVIYFIFCTNVWVFILFYFNLGLNLGAVPRMGR